MFLNLVTYFVFRMRMCTTSEFANSFHSICFLMHVQCATLQVTDLTPSYE
jgi:hypothetical protein